jgi:carbonic anhydrase
MEINGGIGPDDALAILTAGNKRFVSGDPSHPHQNKDWREKLEYGQSPIALVLTCSDSRVVPEFIFDQGIGDLYVVRTAGHVVNDLIVGSMEYAIANLGIPLLYVLGHHKCLEIASSVMVVNESVPSGSFTDVADNIHPAYSAVENKDGDWVYNTVVENVRQVVSALEKREPILSDYAGTGKIKIVGGIYSLKTGLVDRIV